MRVVALCAVIIAGSTFATAVENIYGWSNVKPIAQKTFDSGFKWGAELIDSVYELRDPPPASKSTREKKTAQVR